MDLRQIPLFGALTRRMSWLTQRQQVLAQNVANSDTPGYRARDLKPVDFGSELNQFKRLQLVSTSPSHKQSTAERGEFRGEELREVYEESPTENSVVVEEQMLKVAETRIAYEMMTTLYRKHVDMIKTALGRRS